MATATGTDLVSASLRKIGVLAAGEPLDAAEAQDALDELNRMLETWSLMRGVIYRVLSIVASLVVGQASYTIGAGGDINVTRPVNITNGYTRRGTLDFAFQLINNQQYDGIGIKTLQAPWPTFAYYDPGYPLGTISFWPRPTEANELHLSADYQFSPLTAITDTLSLPPGYKDALVHALGKRLAPEYGKSLSQEFLDDWRACMRALRQSNTVAVEADLDPRLTTARGQDPNWIQHGGYR